jgi:hypothetical protein
MNTVDDLLAAFEPHPVGRIHAILHAGFDALAPRTWPEAQGAPSQPELSALAPAGQ